MVHIVPKNWKNWACHRVGDFGDDVSRLRNDVLPLGFFQEFSKGRDESRPGTLKACATSPLCG